MLANTPSAKSLNVQFSAAILKVASRCNLNCDYCYVYQHSDQSWKSQPKLMSMETIELFGIRLNEYLRQEELDSFSIVFHGGEPLLFSSKRLAEASRVIREQVTEPVVLDFSLQTNGVLLTADNLQILEQAQITVSLSLDGPKHTNDLHRLDTAGRSTFSATMEALQRLNTASSGTFQGVIAVIDPAVHPSVLFEFFYPLGIPRLDLLLPDATHATPPVLREQDPERYVQWLDTAFELWFRHYSEMPVRFFDAILGSRFSLPSPTDALGFGCVNLLVIETDGSYTDHDVFKITKEGFNQLGVHMEAATFQEVAAHPKILEHNFRISPLGAPQECCTCPVLEGCAGGSIMHRYHPTRGFDAPSVYCGEMFALMETASRLIRTSLDDVEEVKATERSETLSWLMLSEELVNVCAAWRQNSESTADSIAQSLGIDRHHIPAAALMLYSEHSQSNPQSLQAFTPTTANAYWNRIRLQSDEPWLTLPFKETVEPYPPDSVQVQYGKEVLHVAERYLSAASPLLPKAIGELISDILFVRSTLRGEQGIFSFSDNSAPNVLYLDPYIDQKPLNPDDVADSILHEFLHQALYHFERSVPLLHDYDFPRFPAPWRAGLRPAGGFLHGTFVFTGLARFWARIAATSLDLPLFDRNKAVQNAQRFREQAIYGIRSTYQFALLTSAGVSFIERLAEQLDEPVLLMRAPGLLEAEFDVAGIK